MSAILALLLCAASGNVYEANLGETGEKAAEVTTAELKQILEKKSAVVFDSRPAREFAVGHIPGALNVAAKPGVPISVYVSDVKAQARALAEAVAREAFNNVAFFAGDPSQIRGAAGGTPTADR